MWRMDVRPKVHECVYGGGPNTNGTAKFYFWAQEPPAIKFRTSWGGATTKRISDEGVSGEKFAYDFVGDGHYLGLRAVDKCPPDLETSIRLRQRLLEETMPSYLSRRSNAQRRPCARRNVHISQVPQLIASFTGRSTR